MIKNYKEALEYIFDFEKIRDYSLSKVKKWTQLLWNPQNFYKIIHIAGTNWKWSTCNMCFWVLKNWWKKVWIFTSPHLLDIRERFKTETWLISEEDFVRITNQILEIWINFSYFEKCVLIALLYFKEKWCEYVIIEVWVWWLLDSTNIVNPVITSITSIWYDHIELLWESIEEISYQKAWIIKPKIPLVINFHNDVIEKIAQEKESQIIFTSNLIKTNLIWEHQLKNAALAFEICKYLWVPENIILGWLTSIEYRWRLDYIQDNLLIDWAHNEQGINILKKYLSQFKDNYKQIVYCFSIKNWKQEKIKSLIINPIWNNQEYILIDYKSNSLASLEDLRKNIGMINYSIKSPQEVKILAKNNKDILYVVFWSLYMIGWFYI